MPAVPVATKVVSSNPSHGEVYSIQHYVIKFVSDLQQVSGFLLVLRFPPTIKLIIEYHMYKCTTHVSLLCRTSDIYNICLLPQTCVALRHLQLSPIRTVWPSDIYIWQRTLSHWGSNKTSTTYVKCLCHFKVRHLDELHISGASSIYRCSII